jgi:hypothetical protein
MLSSQEESEWFGAESFGAESKNCPECDSSNLGYEEMPYCYNCGEANEEDWCSKCDSENVGEEEMDYCYNCGSFGHWYDLEAETFDVEMPKSVKMGFGFGAGLALFQVAVIAGAVTLGMITSKR